MSTSINFAKVGRRVRKAYYWQRNSSPFLSGDAFADAADYQAFPPRFRKNQNSRNTISEAKVMFCPGHLAREFISDNLNQIAARVLIFGNSDEEFSQIDFALPPSVRHIFIQNYLSRNSEMITGIPIGLENLRLGNNGRPNLILNSKPKGSNSILVGPFSMTHAERKEFDINELMAEPRINFLDSRISTKQYSGIAQNFRFIASPRGNGIDTHRFWETLYRGSIPIVKDSIWRQNFKFLEGRIAVTETWAAREILKSVDSVEYQNIDPRTIRELWWPYWRSLINSYL